jgi:alkylated DNA nucleotide flippase Atl1
MPTPYDIGRLTKVPPRTVWLHEANDFTPWLLENADVLTEVLGLDVELKAAEHAVGGFSLDLIGEETVSEAVVIVENQLEESDHTHLGQILTYAGGTDANHIVWVAPSFRQEHRQALEWLNERTDEDTRFFAVKIEVVRIGDSTLAPLLTLVVQPNDWGKVVRRTTSQGAAAQWTREDLLDRTRALHGDDLATKVAALMDQHEALGTGASLWFGKGGAPSVTVIVAAGGLKIQPWALYVDPELRLSVNFDWIHKSGQGISAESMDGFAAALADLPGFSAAAAEARAEGWRRRPGLPALPILSMPGAVDRITDAIRELYAEAEQLGSQVTRSGRFDWSQLHALLSALPVGSWTTYGDLAQVIGTAAQPLGQHVTSCTECPNAYRVLSYNGTIPDGFRWADRSDLRNPEDVLQTEGVRFVNGRADVTQRLRAGDLEGLVGDGSLPR